MKDFIVGVHLTREESLTLNLLFRELSIETFSVYAAAISKLAGAIIDAHDYSQDDDIIVVADEYDIEELTDLILLFEEVEDLYEGLDNMQSIQKVVMLKFLLAVNTAVAEFHDHNPCEDEEDECCDECGC